MAVISQNRYKKKIRIARKEIEVFCLTYQNNMHTTCDFIVMNIGVFITPKGVHTFLANPSTSALKPLLPLSWRTHAALKLSRGKLYMF